MRVVPGVVRAEANLTFAMGSCSASTRPAQSFVTASGFTPFCNLDRDHNRVAAAARASETCFDRAMFAKVSIVNVARDDRLPRTSVVQRGFDARYRAEGEEEGKFAA